VLCCAAGVRGQADLSGAGAIATPKRAMLMTYAAWLHGRAERGLQVVQPPMLTASRDIIMDRTLSPGHEPTHIHNTGHHTMKDLFSFKPRCCTGSPGKERC
jgi:hypothetical protein